MSGDTFGAEKKETDEKDPNNPPVKEFLIRGQDNQIAIFFWNRLQSNRPETKQDKIPRWTEDRKSVT